VLRLAIQTQFFSQSLLPLLSALHLTQHPFPLPVVNSVEKLGLRLAAFSSLGRALHPQQFVHPG
jgi:hypothetical protein